MTKAFCAFLLLLGLAILAFSQALPWPGPGSFVSGGSGASSLLLELKMLDGSGTTATDSCCSDNFTISPGSGSWNASPGSGLTTAYNFNGTLMTAANSTQLNFNFTQPFSVFAVSNLGSITSDEWVMSRLDLANNSRGFGIYYHVTSSIHYVPGFYLINTFGGGNYISVQGSSGTPANVANMVDCLWTYDGSHTAAGVKLYVAGTAVTNTVLSDTLTTTTTNSITPIIGNVNGGGSPFTGIMGPIYVWNRALTASEATALHSNFYAPPN